MTTTMSNICVACLEPMPEPALCIEEIFNVNTGARRHPMCEGKPLLIKVFSMNDCDWMAAKTLEEAKAEYLLNYCGGLDESEAFDDPTELDAKDMLHYKFHDDEDRKVIRTFQDQLEKMIAEGVEFPMFFASIEY